MFVVQGHPGGQAPSGAACQGSTIQSAHMPLLTELERGLVGLRSYRHAAPNGAFQHVPALKSPGQVLSH